MAERRAPFGFVRVHRSFLVDRHSAKRSAQLSTVTVGPKIHVGYRYEDAGLAVIV